MLVYQMIEKLMKEDPLATVVTRTNDHGYREVDIIRAEAEEARDDLHEYHGEENRVDSEEGEIIPIVIIE